MRPWLPILALGALGLASPASADVTARYAGTGKYGPTMSVAVDESGQVRAEAGPPNNASERLVLIRREGVDYISAADIQGRFVARADDLIAVANETIRASMPERAREGMRGFADIRFDIGAGGMETVGGRQGRVYPITPIVPPPARAASGDDEADQEPEAMAAPAPLELVISDDPELAPIGREMARLFESTTGPIEAVMGTRPAALGQIQELLARGTLIRFTGEFRLRSVSTDAIAESAFVLPPGPVLTRAQLRARMPRPPRAADAGADRDND